VVGYAGSAAGVRVLLDASGNATGIGGDAEGDTLIGIEALLGSANADTLGGRDLDGGLGADTLTGTTGTDVLLGGEGNDSVSGGDGADTQDGGLQADLLQGGGGADSLQGGGGADTLQGGQGGDTLDGGAGGDRMVGGAGNDLFLLSGADTLEEAAAGGLDTVRAAVSWSLGAEFENLELTGAATATGTGNTLANLIAGNEAANTLAGQTGADTLLGGGGQDSLGGGGGLDRLDGGTAADTMAGGNGDDTFVVDDAGDRAVELAGGGTGDLVLASVSFTLGAEVERLLLTGGADIAGGGNTLDNVVTGNGGANSLSGFGGADTLQGGPGNDTLQGGAGGDSLSSGSGLDAFRYGNATQGGDTIQGYAVADDVIQVSAGGFGGGLAVGALSGTAFATNDAGTATAAAHRFIWEGDARALWFDVDGNAAGGVAAVRIATFTGTVTLTANEIAVIA
jgi:Ca2+-binding RTX toxin-like protein